MNSQSIKRWSLAFAVAFSALLTVTLIINQPAVWAQPTDVINCSGPIQPCIDAATDGDTILVAPGTYTESLTLNKPISLTGESSATTILHAETGQRVLTITGATIDGSVVISGLSFSGGNVSDGSLCPDNCGGGILITDTAQPAIHNVVISDNQAYQGGGLYASAALSLTNVEVISNTALNNGGGLRVGGELNISNTKFVANSAASTGGAVWQDVSTGDLQSRIENSLFARNSAGDASAALSLGGEGNVNHIVFTTIADGTLNNSDAIGVVDGTLYITNTIITSHSVGISVTGGSVTEDYNLFFGNPITTSGTISNGANSLSGDPLFVDPLIDDYHLSLGSAAIDTGVDTGIASDVDGDARPAGEGFDIGFDEFLFKIYMPYLSKS